LFDNPPSVYELIEFMDYFTETWLEGSFPLELWNHEDHNQQRTNNNIEGYNNSLTKFLGFHPNIWLFINKIKTEESIVATNYYRILNDTYKQRRRNGANVERENRLLKLKCDFLEDEISLLEYLEKAAVQIPTFD
jgi:hypothetical protein